MRARPRYLLVLAVALAPLLIGAACAEEDQTLTGLITGIEESDGVPTSFELTVDGEEPTTIHLDRQIDYGFDLAHMHEHMDAEWPVKVTLEERDGDRYATKIEDA